MKGSQEGPGAAWRGTPPVRGQWRGPTQGQDSAARPDGSPMQRSVHPRVGLEISDEPRHQLSVISENIFYKKETVGTSLMVQRGRIRFLVQGMRV